MSWRVCQRLSDVSCVYIVALISLESSMKRLNEYHHLPLGQLRFILALWYPNCFCVITVHECIRAIITIARTRFCTAFPVVYIQLYTHQFQPSISNVWLLLSSCYKSIVKFRANTSMYYTHTLYIFSHFLRYNISVKSIQHLVFIYFF